MRITGISNIGERERENPQLKHPLELWLKRANDAKWTRPQDIKDQYPSASFIPSNRVIFNIKGNRFRLIATINYERQTLHINWFGNHRDYDHIDANRVRR